MPPLIISFCRRLVFAFFEPFLHCTFGHPRMLPSVDMSAVPLHNRRAGIFFPGLETANHL